MNKKCECCNKKLKFTMGGQKRCSSCSAYTRELREKILNLKRKLERLKGK